MTDPRQSEECRTNCPICSCFSSRRFLILAAIVTLVLGALLLANQLIRRAEGAAPSEGPVAAKPSEDGHVVRCCPSGRRCGPSGRRCCPSGRRCGPVRGLFRARRSCRRYVVPPAGTHTDRPKKKEDPYRWKTLFDGKTLDGWKAPQFGGEGEVEVKDGTIVLNMGESMTGVTYTGEVPRMNFEVQFDTMRLAGTDFFGTVTFPVDKEHCSFVLGGWGGVVVGLSNVDYYDAGDNITTQFHDLKDKHWYRVRVRVSEHRIEAWIDDEKMVDLPTKKHKFGIRYEVDLCRPLGIASWCTAAALKNIRLRRLKPEEVAAAEKQQ